MSEYLAKYTKSDLLLLADEFETRVSKTNKNRAVIEAIIEASDYDKKYIKIRVEGIFNEEAEGQEQEKENDRQIELDRITQDENVK